MLIENIIDTDRNEYVSAYEYLDLPDKESHLIRIKAGERGKTNPLFLCHICDQPLNLKGGRNGSSDNYRVLHFAHIASGDQNTCPLTRNKGKVNHALKILAKKHGKWKESEDHKRIKDAIAQTLRSDPNAKDVLVERRINGPDGRFRIPDIQCTWGGKRVVFEVQLSTTFLPIIIGREKFYESNGIYIIWVFREFNESAFTSKDIYYNNKTQLLVFQDSKDGVLKFTSFFKMPFITRNQCIDEEWRFEEDVTLNDLFFEPSNNYKPYFIDTDIHRDYLKHKIDFEGKKRAEKKRQKAKILSGDFLDVVRMQILEICISSRLSDKKILEHLVKIIIKKYRERYNTYPGFAIHECIGNFQHYTRTMISCVYGCVFDFGWPRLKSVAHNICQYELSNLRVFMGLLYLFGNEKKLFDEFSIKNRIMFKKKLDKAKLTTNPLADRTMFLRTVEFFIPGFSLWFEQPIASNIPTKSVSNLKTILADIEEPYEREMLITHQASESQGRLNFPESYIIQLDGIHSKLRFPNYLDSHA